MTCSASVFTRAELDLLFSGNEVHILPETVYKGVVAKGICWCVRRSCFWEGPTKLPATVSEMMNIILQHFSFGIVDGFRVPAVECNVPNIDSSQLLFNLHLKLRWKDQVQTTHRSSSQASQTSTNL